MKFIKSVVLALAVTASTTAAFAPASSKLGLNFPSFF